MCKVKTAAETKLDLNSADTVECKVQHCFSGDLVSRSSEALYITPSFHLRCSSDLAQTLNCPIQVRFHWECEICLFVTKMTEAFLSFHPPGCQAEVPISAGGGHGEAGRTGEEDRKGRWGVEALLGGPQVGQTGQSAVHRRTCRSLYGRVFTWVQRFGPQVSEI